MDDKTRQRVIWGLRRMSYKMGWRHQVLRRARLPYGEFVCYLCGIERRKITHACAGCAQPACNKCVDADHIVPIVSGGKFVDWNSYLEGLFTDPKENGQALCKVCHKAKSAQEATGRAEKRKDAQSKTDAVQLGDSPSPRRARRKSPASPKKRRAARRRDVPNC